VGDTSAGKVPLSFVINQPKITCKKTLKSKMTFISSKPKIAAVDKNTGKVTIKNTGVATITIKAGKASKKVTVKVSPKKPSVKSANTSKGKKYYVRIHSYKKSGKETLYSAWSKAKVSGKIKK
jgi:Bacterial Ig-like domain (group 2).